MKKAVKIALFAIFIPIALLYAQIPAAAEEEFRNPEAAAALLAEVDAGMILYSKNSDIPQQPYDLAKVMTLLLLVSACETGSADPDELVEMTETAYFDINSMSTTQGIQPGEEMTVLDLMYCAYIGGANEACNLLAEYLSGSTTSFVANMNARAKELGCLKTNFSNTHGQYDMRQYTTASDMFIIYREAIRYPLFLEISGTYRYSTKSVETSDKRNLTTSNALLNPNSKYYYRPCASGIPSPVFEVGYHEVADIDGGYSLISSAESDGLSLICVILGSNAVFLEDDSVEMRNLTETQRLYEWGFSHFSRRTILSTTDPVAKAPVTHGAGADFVNLRPESAITLLLENGVLDEEFERTVTIYSEKNGETLYAPVSAGDVLGEILLTRGNEKYGPVLLVANTNIELNRVQFIRMKISDMLATRAARFVMWLLTILVLAYIALVIRYNILRRRRLRKIAEAKARLSSERRSVNRELWSDIKENESEISGLGSGNRNQGSGKK